MPFAFVKRGEGNARYDLGGLAAARKAALAKQKPSSDEVDRFRRPEPPRRRKQADPELTVDWGTKGQPPPPAPAFPDLDEFEALEKAVRTPYKSAAGSSSSAPPPPPRPEDTDWTTRPVTRAPSSLEEEAAAAEEAELQSEAAAMSDGEFVGLDASFPGISLVAGKPGAARAAPGAAQPAWEDEYDDEFAMPREHDAQQRGQGAGGGVAASMRLSAARRAELAGADDAPGYLQGYGCEQGAMDEATMEGAAMDVVQRGLSAEAQEEEEEEGEEEEEEEDAWGACGPEYGFSAMPGDRLPSPTTRPPAPAARLSRGGGSAAPPLAPPASWGPPSGTSRYGNGLQGAAGSSGAYDDEIPPPQSALIASLFKPKRVEATRAGAFMPQASLGEFGGVEEEEEIAQVQQAKLITNRAAPGSVSNGKGGKATARGSTAGRGGCSYSSGPGGFGCGGACSSSGSVGGAGNSSAEVEALKKKVGELTAALRAAQRQSASEDRTTSATLQAEHARLSEELAEFDRCIIYMCMHLVNQGLGFKFTRGRYTWEVGNTY